MITYLFALLAAGAAPQSAAPTGERAADSQDKMICKRFVETGSLVKGNRVCKTKRDWERERDQARANMTSTNGCKSLNGASPGC